jgi:ABC-type uncharacterized transport system substrate-binding protein
MNRRAFITLLGGAAATWPLAARAQQAAMPVVGFLRSTSAAGSEHLTTAFRRGLVEAGFVEGQNVGIDYRWAEDQGDRLPMLAADLVRRRVALIYANGAAVPAAKAATATIPIVFTSGIDPVRAGFVASLNRPGGNVTGVVFPTEDLLSKRLGLLYELAPKAAVIAVLLNPNEPTFEFQLREAEPAGRAVGRDILIVKASNEYEINSAFATIVQERAGALLVGAGPFFWGRRRLLAALAIRHVLPASYDGREFAEAGGLMCYGASQTDAFRRAGIYVGRVLRGEKPANLPVDLATKFDLIINLATAKAMGFDIPPMLLARADEVIE